MIGIEKGIRIALVACVLAACTAWIPQAPARLPDPATASLADPSSQADSTGEECTIALVSGRATADGRPLLWKNRDAGYMNNEVVYFNDGAYAYVTLVTAGETDKAWLGVNDRGFAIMNSLSYNLPDTYQGGITNGALMKLALQTCAGVGDFERLLQETNKTGRQNPANLGAIDAGGRAVLFEAGNWSYKAFDAGDPKVAPGGFVVRANLSLSADTTGFNTWRWRRALALVEKAVAEGGAKVPDLAAIARDLHAADCDPYPLPYSGTPPGWPDAFGYVRTDETINRRTTVAGGVVRGVLPGEDPRLSVFYAALGQPVVAPFLPVWAAAGKTPPEVDGPITAPICNLAMTRAAGCYDYPYYSSLLNTRQVMGVPEASMQNLPLVQGIEDWLFARTDKQLALWRSSGFTPEGLSEFEHEMAAAAYLEYRGVGPHHREPLAGFLTCSPNPTRGITGIRYRSETAAPGRVEVEIFDATGRRAARLVLPADPEPRMAQRAPGGRHDAANVAEPVVWWDGRDDRGQEVPSGVYFCRPTWPAGAPGRSFIVIR